MDSKENIKNVIICIQPLVNEDIKKLEPILRQHVRNRKTQELETGEIEDIKQYMNGTKLDSDKRKRKYLVAKDEIGTVLGCMAYSSPDKDMVNHFRIKGDDTVELLNAFVSSDVFRGGGVGKKLFEAVCATAKYERKRQIVIHSGPRYKKSWGFYDKVCGQNTGMLIGKYGDPGEGDAMTWKKNI